jgi:hypothetical protein
MFIRRYVDHFLEYPHSMIVKFVGMYSMDIVGKDRVSSLSCCSLKTKLRYVVAEWFMAHLTCLTYNVWAGCGFNPSSRL